MSGTLVSIFRGSFGDYAPLSKAAVRRIIAFDAAQGFGPGGTKANRNRFYLYLTQRGSDVEVRTVAVKSPKRWKEPMVKEVARASVDDPWIHIRDLGFIYMCGYAVDWTPEGFGPERQWDYRGRWEDEVYSRSGMWKIDAPVVNPDLLKRTRRFRWCGWDPERGHILDFLKIYSEHPEIEFLAKSGLEHFCTKILIVRKLKKDCAFRRFFRANVDEIRDCRWSVPVILKAYKTGVSFLDAAREIDARREFRYCGLPRCVCATRAFGYVQRRKIPRGHYAAYLHNCETLGLDLADTKVSFPKQFERRRQIVRDQVDVIRAKQSAKKNRDLNRKISAAADAFQWLERKGRVFRVVMPRSVHDLEVEGRKMSNCLGNCNYASKIARGDSLIVFVRQASAPDAAFVAVEYSLTRGIVTQCYGANNSKPPKRVRDFVNRVFEGVGKERLEVAA